MYLLRGAFEGALPSADGPEDAAARPKPGTLSMKTRPTPPRKDRNRERAGRPNGCVAPERRGVWGGGEGRSSLDRAPRGAWLEWGPEGQDSRWEHRESGARGRRTPLPRRWAPLDRGGSEHVLSYSRPTIDKREVETGRLS